MTKSLSDTCVEVNSRLSFVIVAFFVLFCVLVLKFWFGWWGMITLKLFLFLLMNIFLVLKHASWEIQVLFLAASKGGNRETVLRFLGGEHTEKIWGGDNGHWKILQVSVWLSNTITAGFNIHASVHDDKNVIMHLLMMIRTLSWGFKVHNWLSLRKFSKIIDNFPFGPETCAATNQQKEW